MIVAVGSQDQSVVIRIVDSTDGSPEEGVTSATPGLSLWYWRQGGTVTALTESDLAAIDSAHSDGGMKHADDGYYRVDIPDAAFLTGVPWVVIGGAATGMVVIGLQVEIGGVTLADDAITSAKFDESTAFPLRAADTGATQVARTGADADTLETLSDQLDAAEPADVWAYATRTLTQSAASVVSAVAGSAITCYRGTSWSITLTGLSPNTGYTSLWFAVKNGQNDTDAESLVLIRKNATGLTDGLLYLNGAAAATAANGSITINSATSITIALDEVEAALLTPTSGLSYGVKMLNAGAVTYLADGEGLFTIDADVPRAVV